LRLSESTKRTVRTAYVVVLTLAVVVIPGLLTVVPARTSAYVVLSGFAAAVVAVNRVVAFLEDRGVLPAFLRDVEPRADVVDAIASAAADAVALQPQLPGAHTVDEVARAVTDPTGSPAS